MALLVKLLFSPAAVFGANLKLSGTLVPGGILVAGEWKSGTGPLGLNGSVFRPLLMGDGDRIRLVAGSHEWASGKRSLPARLDPPE